MGQLVPPLYGAVLVHLREKHGDAADLVGLISADPSLLLTPLPDRDDSDAALAERRRRRAAARVAAASSAANTVVARVGARVGAATDGSVKDALTDGREDGKWKVQGTYKGTSSRAEDLKVRFWNLWGGSSECRKAVTESPRGSVFRDPARMEAAVVRLDRYMPFVDAPMLLHRAPPLLELRSEELVRRVARMKMTLRGGDIGRLLVLAPSLLLATEDELQAAVGLHNKLNPVVTHSA
jgi:hypothetical protein